MIINMQTPDLAKREEVSLKAKNKVDKYTWDLKEDLDRSNMVKEQAY